MINIESANKINKQSKTMNIKYPHQQLIDYFQKFFPEWQREEFDRQRQIEKVVAWVVGLATGAIALIVSQSLANPVLDPKILKITVFCLLLTVILGVVYRATYYF